MTSPSEPTSAAPSLRSLRVVAAIGGLVACALVVLGFSVGVLAGLVALFVLPVIPLVFVLGFEAVRGGRGVA